MTGRTITSAQAQAVKVYGRHFETLQLEAKPMARLAAQDGLKAARAVLTPQEVAILDLVAGRGRTIADVAAAAGRPRVAMEDLILGAADKLIAHYEARPKEAA